MSDEGYHLIPTRRKNGSKPPQGWIDLRGMMGPSRRMMTEGYISQRLPRTNTIGMNQNYVLKILDNPRTPECNRRAVIDYVLTHQDKFIALPDNTDDEEMNEWAKKRNGSARFGFMRMFKEMYLSRR